MDKLQQAKEWVKLQKRLVEDMRLEQEMNDQWMKVFLKEVMIQGAEQVIKIMEGDE